MDKSLQKYISHLEHQIESLKKQLAESGSSSPQYSSLRFDLGIAERALIAFRKAYKLERKRSK